MKKVIKKSFYVGVVLSIFSGVISCEKDFKDLGTSIINNTKFNTKDTVLDIVLTNSPLERLKSDNISSEQGQYLLGVYNHSDYEKIEASIISQIAINPELKLVENTYGADTTVISTIDTVYLKLPYQSTLDQATSSGPEYSLDSIVGDQTKEFSLNIYQLDTYLSTLNPVDPSKLNSYDSDHPFVKTGSELNATPNFQFKPNYAVINSGLSTEKKVAIDTMMIIKRRLSNSNVYDKDTIKYSIATINHSPLPFARIPLDEVKFKQLFLDKYESSDFESQNAFNNYFRGLILEATGNDGSLISFDFQNENPELNPSIEVYYTNTVLKAGTTVIDTIKKRNTFSLAGIRSNSFKMGNRVYPVNNEVKIQGAAGSEAKLDILIGNQINELRAKNWLINDASITLYINKNADTASLPRRLFLYKNGLSSTSQPVFSQIKDSYSELDATFGGYLATDNSVPDSYTFRITDYISDILSGATDYAPSLKLKNFNTSDLPVSDSIFRLRNWNPKAVTILNHSSSNGVRKAQLKISYSEKKNN